MRELTVQQIVTAFLAIGVRLSGLMLFAPFLAASLFRRGSRQVL